MPTLEEIRAVLAARAARQAAPEPQQPFDPSVIEAAFAAALSRFTTSDGSLKVANQVGGHAIGGS